MAEDLNSLSLSELLGAVVRPTDLDGLLDMAVREELGERGDITGASTVPADREGVGWIRAREAGVLAGGQLVRRILGGFDERLETTLYRVDGEPIAAGDPVAKVGGPLRGLLAGERTVLNFLSILSGIATQTRRCVDAVEGTRVRIFDTRKTIPGWRGLSKFAVRCGGGFCHRTGLYDAVLIKDNHLASFRHGEWVERLREAVAAARRLDPPPSFIEVEVDALDQLERAVGAGVDVVLLDNMGRDDLAEAVRVRDREAPRVELEASGGVDLRSVRLVAETGVDRIAVGTITHSAPAVDIALDLESDRETAGGEANP